MGAALRTDPSQISVDDLLKTKKCPLARKLRKKLRKNGVGEGITCVYSTEEVNFDYGEQEEYEDGGPSCQQKRRPRRLLGSLPTLTGILASLSPIRLCIHCWPGTKILPDKKRTSGFETREGRAR